MQLHAGSTLRECFRMYWSPPDLVPNRVLQHVLCYQECLLTCMIASSAYCKTNKKSATKVNMKFDPEPADASNFQTAAGLQPTRPSEANWSTIAPPSSCGGPYQLQLCKLVCTLKDRGTSPIETVLRHYLEAKLAQAPQVSAGFGFAVSL